MAKKGSKGGSTVAAVEAMARPVVEGMGLELWDVVFEKEGADWNLCLLIDKEGGVDLEDCEKVSREIDPKLDEMDPIEQSYYLVVSSPGVNRLLTKPEHFARYQGSPVLVRTIRPVEGARDFSGVLGGFSDGRLTLETADGKAMEFALSETAYVKLDDFDDQEIREL